MFSGLQRDSNPISGLLCDSLNRNHNCDDHMHLHFIHMSAVHIIFISTRLTASGSRCRLHKNQHLSFQIPIRSGMQGHLLKRSPVALLGVPKINETISSIYYLLLFLSSDRQCRCFDISAIIFIGNKSKQPCKGQRNCFK